MTDTAVTNPFADAEVIYAYTRKQAIEDGVQVDANVGDLAEVTRQHYKYPVYMTRAVWDMIEKAVENKRWCNDFRGVWHDLLWMSKCYKPARQDLTHFYCIIKGVGRQSKFAFTARVEALDIDNPAPAITISLYGED